MKTLIFNNENIYYTYQEGEFYIAVKPVCQALNIKYVHQFEQIKLDPILVAAFRKYGTQVGNQKREMIYLPERLVYGWLFQINSKEPVFLEYKYKCYEILYNHFSGQLINRKKLLTAKSEIISKKNKLCNKLIQNQDFVTYLELEKQEKSINYKIKKIDNQEVSDNLSLFDEL